VRELASTEFGLAAEAWREYHQTWGDPAMDRVFGLFAGRTLASLAMCRRHPDGCELDALFTPARYRGRGYARRVVAGLVEACDGEDLFMYAVAGLEEFYAGFGFRPVHEAELPPSIRARYDWSVGDRSAARITPMRRRAAGR
jgi:N-acetylglutamate synthase-like GNAT family acetyltransferase